MHAWVRPSISRFLGVVIIAWLCGMSPAWAGDGGEDGGAAQTALNTVCALVGMTSCPQLPTVTQMILEISGLENTPPDFVRGPQGSFNTPSLPFGGLCSVSSVPNLPVCSRIAINSVNPPAPSPLGISDLASLTPLAFTTGKGQAVPVPLGTSGANSYFYAVVTAEQNSTLNTLTIFFDYPLQTNANFQKGKVFATVSIPLQILSNGNERLICGPSNCPASVATLQISANCSTGQNCLTANVIGDVFTAGLTGTTTSAAALGIQPSVFFTSSPNSAASHLIVEVKVPLLLTAGSDPAYFGAPPSAAGSPTFANQLSGLPTGFTTEVVHSSKVGLAPVAAPTCLNGTCPSPPSPIPTTTLPFCASFSGGSGPLGSGSPQSAVATFLSIGTDGTVYVSSPVPPLPTWLKCPF